MCSQRQNVNEYEHKALMQTKFSPRRLHVAKIDRIVGLEKSCTRIRR